MQIISILMEALILVLGLMIALGKKEIYGWGFIITFGIYVIYDLAKDNFIPFALPQSVMSVIFFIATLSMLWTAWYLYKRGK